MGWFSKLRRRAADVREADDATTRHLRDFVTSRTDVEAWVEEPTGFNPPSILLIAWDGEWTRRRCPSTQWADDFCARYQVPAHPAGIVPYPQRMRDYDARRKIEQRRAEEA